MKRQKASNTVREAARKVPVSVLFASRRKFASWLLRLLMAVMMLAQSPLAASAQSSAGGKETTAQRPPVQTATQLQQNQALQNVVAKQAALVSEFDVNGLKVLVK